MSNFKDNIRDKATSLGIIKNEELSSLFQYIYDYERLILSKEDFSKRKRVKNIVDFCERCCAKRATNEQCTRRKKEGIEYCGTHMKGTPHGIIDNQEDAKVTTQKVEVWAQDIQGIIYYMKLSNIITILGITLVIFYSVIQILNFYGISISSYGIYLVFFVFMLISYVILPHQYPTL